METGARSHSPVRLYGPSIATSNGAVILEHGTLKLINADAEIVWNLHRVSTNAHLFLISDHSVGVKELNQVYAVNLKTAQKTTICSDINVIGIQYSQDNGLDIVECVGEKKDGTKVRFPQKLERN